MSIEDTPAGFEAAKRAGKLSQRLARSGRTPDYAALLKRSHGKALQRPRKDVFPDAPGQG